MRVYFDWVPEHCIFAVADSGDGKRSKTSPPPLCVRREKIPGSSLPFHAVTSGNWESVRCPDGSCIHFRSKHVKFWFPVSTMLAISECSGETENSQRFSLLKSPLDVFWPCGQTLPLLATLNKYTGCNKPASLRSPAPSPKNTGFMSWIQQTSLFSRGWGWAECRIRGWPQFRGFGFKYQQLVTQAAVLRARVLHIWRTSLGAGLWSRGSRSFLLKCQCWGRCSGIPHPCTISLEICFCETCVASCFLVQPVASWEWKPRCLVRHEALTNCTCWIATVVGKIFGFRSIELKLFGRRVKRVFCCANIPSVSCLIVLNWNITEKSGCSGCEGHRSFVRFQDKGLWPSSCSWRNSKRAFSSGSVRLLLALKSRQVLLLCRTVLVGGGRQSVGDCKTDFSWAKQFETNRNKLHLAACVWKLQCELNFVWVRFDVYAPKFVVHCEKSRVYLHVLSC